MFTVVLPVLLTIQARADISPPGRTKVCTANADQLEFGGVCSTPRSPSAPTRPAFFHAWALTQPVNHTGCVPYDQTTWADGTAAVGGPQLNGYFFYDGQKIPRVLSDPRTDWGWEWYIPCDPKRALQFVGIVHMPRAPSPCPTGQPDCRPGASVPGFLAAARGVVPAERIEVDPAAVGVVNVRVLAALDPVPVQKAADVRVTVADGGDLDPGERVHVLWIVTATPEPWQWRWPDGSASAIGRWVPQQDQRGAEIRVNLVYAVTAAGFWSDGITIHDLPGFTVGTIAVPSSRSYDVQQVQPVAP